MKILVIAAYMALGVISGNFANGLFNHGGKYCAETKNGKTVIMHEGKQMTSDVTLSNGTMIKTDGTIIHKNGTRTMLKSGDCVDNNGDMVNSNKNDATYPNKNDNNNPNKTNPD